MVTLRPLTEALNAPQPSSVTVTVTPHNEGHAVPVPNVPNAASAWHGNSLELSVPLAQVGLGGADAHETLYVAAETRFADLAVDRTGFRGVICDPTLTASR